MLGFPRVIKPPFNALGEHAGNPSADVANQASTGQAKQIVVYPQVALRSGTREQVHVVPAIGKSRVARIKHGLFGAP